MSPMGFRMLNACLVWAIFVQLAFVTIYVCAYEEVDQQDTDDALAVNDFDGTPAEQR